VNETIFLAIALLNNFARASPIAHLALLAAVSMILVVSAGGCQYLVVIGLRPFGKVVWVSDLPFMAM